MYETHHCACKLLDVPCDLQKYPSLFWESLSGQRGGCHCEQPCETKEGALSDACTPMNPLSLTHVTSKVTGHYPRLCRRPEPSGPFLPRLFKGKKKKAFALIISKVPEAACKKSTSKRDLTGWGIIWVMRYCGLRKDLVLKLWISGWCLWALGHSHPGFCSHVCFMSAACVTGDKEGAKSMIHQFLGLPAPFEVSLMKHEQTPQPPNRSHLSGGKFKKALVKWSRFPSERLKRPFVSLKQE